MDEFIKELDVGLDVNYVNVPTADVFPYVCTNEKSFQDLPIMGKKTKVIIENRKFFCDNPDCTFTTFAERFDFLKQNGKKRTPH